MTLPLESARTAAEVTPIALARSAAGRRLLVKESPTFFATYYLGHPYAAHQDRWYDMFEAHERLLLLAPRDHGKTEAAVRVYAESRICSDRNIRILVVSKTQDEARKRVDQVRLDIQNNTRIKEDFGGFAPRITDTPKGRIPHAPQRWTSTQFYVSGRRPSRDATMEGVGVLGAITGGHFDLIILDDVVDLTDAASQAQRDAKWKWFQGTVLKLVEPWTKVIVIGTRKHADDIYGRIIGGEGRFEVVTDRAIPDQEWLGRGEWRYLTRVGEGGRIVTYGVEVTGERTEPLWPERWSLEKLLLEYRESSVTFMRESQNCMIDDDSTFVKRVYFTGGTSPSAPGLTFPGCYQREGPFSRLVPTGEVLRDPLGLDVLQAWDLSLEDDRKQAERKDTDFTVGITVGFDRKTRNRYLLGFYRDRGLLPSQIQLAIRKEAARFPTRVVVGLEINAFGKMHQLGLRATTDLPLRAHLTTGQKKVDPVDGLVKFVGLLENGKWRFPMGDEPSRRASGLIESEMVGYGVEAHDDTLMAMWIMECLLLRWEGYLDQQDELRRQAEAEESGDDWRVDVDAIRD